MYSDKTRLDQNKSLRYCHTETTMKKEGTKLCLGGTFKEALILGVVVYYREWGREILMGGGEAERGRL